MLRTLMDKADNMQEQMDNVSKKMEILRTKNNTIDQKHCNRYEQ